MFLTEVTPAEALYKPSKKKAYEVAKIQNARVRNTISYRYPPGGADRHKDAVGGVPPKNIFIFTTMNCKVFLTFLLFTTSLLNAQNLVPNPSFEEHLECPYSTAEFHMQVVDWYSWQETPDYFHTCNNELNGNAGVPENAWGWQWPITGDAYAGIFTYASHVVDGREYMAVPLLTPLEIGVNYYVMFYTSLYDLIFIHKCVLVKKLLKA